MEYRSDSQRERLIQVLEMVAPGTELREAVDRILQIGSGALIVVGNISELRPIMSGGFNINCEFTAPRLFELSKMDGAVVVSDDLKTIYSANVHLVPDPRIPSSEAGMKHRTAERVAKQTSAFVLAISEKMRTVSIYVGDMHFTLENIPLVLARADQALQTLSRYRARLDMEFNHLNTLEVEDMVALRDVVKVVQRVETIMRIADEISFQVSELGKDGRLVSLQLGELMAGVERARLMLIKDYYVPRDERNPEMVLSELESLTTEELVDDERVARALGFSGGAEVLNKLVRPKGYRMLSMVPRIPTIVINKLVERFENLRNIMKASPALLDEVDGIGEKRAHAIKKGLERITESIIMESHT